MELHQTLTVVHRLAAVAAVEAIHQIMVAMVDQVAAVDGQAQQAQAARLHLLVKATLAAQQMYPTLTVAVAAAQVQQAAQELHPPLAQVVQVQPTQLQEHR
jgi:hypothetical protein